MHRILEFNQSQWLKSSVEFITQKRIETEQNRRIIISKKWKKWKRVVQINEQCCIQQKNEILEKWNQCKTCKQQGGHSS